MFFNHLEEIKSSTVEVDRIFLKKTLPLFFPNGHSFLVSFQKCGIITIYMESF